MIPNPNSNSKNLKYVIPKSKIGLIKSFLSRKQKHKWFLMGRNDLSKKISNDFAISGFVDDFFVENFWNGSPIVKSENLPSNSVVVNCSMSIHPISSQTKLESINIVGTLNYMDLCLYDEQNFPLPDFVKNFKIDYIDNYQEYDCIYNRLSDRESKKVLRDIIGFKYTGNIKYMKNYKFLPKEQYFPKFIKLTDEEVFVDCGGYNGDTSEEFCRRVNNYKKIYFFEPSKKNLDDAKKRLSRFENIVFFEEGLSDEEKFMNFNPDLGSSSSFDKDGKSIIKVGTIDNRVIEPATFIKMDIEGCELEALDGCISQIKKYKPKLAISVYHKSDDLRNIFNKITEFNPNYKVYLRHYTEGWSETIMYFI